ncbi:MAG TPA: hypothetical protein PKO36_01965 [Candidatus Hydrogenedentes bacterium]|nr:hypothetical protein [Candidatus Hydrogenedentota bacterium]HRT18869.1 hypothetical protein [Candidatus Hydrogenedentota bacterium]HRT65594.1 hypothetical protein [Candidatus Hydrogenedentota bacterium]
MQARAEIQAGVCGFHTDINTSSEDGMSVVFDVASDCDKIRALSESLMARGPINAYEEISPASDSVIMATVRECLKGCCAGCAVPVGLFKSMQVAAGLALPKDIAIRIEKG